MEYSIENISFSGPLDLLLDLIKKNKYDIKNIFIVDIINQYLAVIEQISKENLEIASEFIVMATTLMEIKSRYFIFINDAEDKIDPGKELIEILEKYKKYKEISEKLKNIYITTEPNYRNKEHEVFTEKTLDLSGFSLENLKNAYMKLSHKKPEIRPQIVSFKKISVDDKIHEIEKILYENANIYFNKILNSNEKDEVVATLLGVLELAKDQRVDLIQKTIFQDILIERLYTI